MAAICEHYDDDDDDDDDLDLVKPGHFLSS
jgi:hypothetical protein